jgi:hypothetical protein
MRIMATLLFILTWASEVIAQTPANSGALDICPNSGGQVVETINKNRSRQLVPLAELNCAQSQFVSAYAALLNEQLDGLQGFIDAVNDPTDSICNLLCQRALATGFVVHERASPVDLIRYVFTATCFGVLVSQRELALKQLDDLLAAIQRATDQHGIAKIFGNLSAHERHYIRGQFGDVLHAVDKNVPLKFEHLKTLWTQPWEKSDGSAAHRTAPPQLATELAREDACSSRFVKAQPRAQQKAE